MEFEEERKLLVMNLFVRKLRRIFKILDTKLNAWMKKEKIKGV